MFDFIVRNGIIQSAQRFIDKLTPDVAVHIPKELPLPSVSVVKKMAATTARINALEPQMQKLTDDELRAKTGYFRQKIAAAIQKSEDELRKVKELYHNCPLDDEEQRSQLDLEFDKTEANLKKSLEGVLKEILPAAFAVVRETSRRVLRMRHFDVQLVGGMVLHEGKIAEMATGEGKTLVATLSAYLNALPGKGVHIVTVNDYLARRDREWMGPIYEFLGLSVGVIQHDIRPSDRQQAYNCDITYGTNNEFGFDYLRDNMVSFQEEMVQRKHHYAIVDEVDSILIDEARTPLIISGPAEESTDTYYRAHEVSKQLKGRRITEKDEIEAKHRGENISEGYDYVADEKARSISMTETGEEKAAKAFGVDNLHEMETIEYRHHILQALKAKEFFNLDVDYVVKDGKVIIVDEFTGRLMPGRRWSDGLHQAVEAKEGIRIERENQTLATITFQNYFKMYAKLSGMTGTAYTEANEFKQIYNLDCVVMPTNRVLRRANDPDCIYRSTKEKFTAVVEEIAAHHQKGRPVLVGTISIENSELLSRMLKSKGVTHQVLNAKYHELEAHIIAQAGRYKAVTIATNMAGRGTDIVLGGNAEHMAQSLAREKAKEADDPKQEEELRKKFLEQFRKEVAEEHEKVVQAGGLHVLGTERHESRRIDNQLRGRSGRQGDPGSSRFYVSLEDNLMRLFGENIMNVWNRLGVEEGQVIEHPLVSRAIEIAQKRVENHNFEIRKQLLEYDNVMNKQREAIYGLRREILEGSNIKGRIMEAVAQSVDSILKEHLAPIEGEESRVDFQALVIYLKAKFGLDISGKVREFEEMSEEDIRAFLIEQLQSAYEHKEQDVGTEHLRHLERMLLLHTIDAKWKDHLHAMDNLKEGIGLRAYGQRDPLIEYKREGFVMFQMMFESINREVAETIFRVQPPTPGRERLKGVFSSLPQRLIHNEFSSLDQRRAGQAPAGVAPRPSPETPGAAPNVPASQPQTQGPKVGRNDPCPCGSGKKYKKCCGR
jgi:preprotein translocase subunit SecA